MTAARDAFLSGYPSNSIVDDAGRCSPINGKSMTGSSPGIRSGYRPRHGPAVFARNPKPLNDVLSGGSGVRRVGEFRQRPNDSTLTWVA